MLRLVSLLIVCGTACMALGMVHVDENLQVPDAVIESYDHPSVFDVVGDLVLPYSGPIHVLMFEDGIVINVGGNIGPFAIDFASDVVYGGDLEFGGLGEVFYDDQTGHLFVAVGLDFSFEMNVRYRSEIDVEEDALLDNADCPVDKKCCECTGRDGSANAVCDSDERPVCLCSRTNCCTGTCIPKRNKIEVDGFHHA